MSLLFCFLKKFLLPLEIIVHSTYLEFELKFRAVGSGIQQSGQISLWHLSFWAIFLFYWANYFWAKVFWQMSMGKFRLGNGRSINQKWIFIPYHHLFRRWVSRNVTSGAIQQGVPTNVCLDLALLWSPPDASQADTPKSAIWTWPSEPSKILPALISRWMWPLLWRYSSPFKTSLSTVAMVDSSNTPFLQS